MAPANVQPQMTGATMRANADVVPAMPFTRALTASSHELFTTMVMLTNPIPNAQIFVHCDTSATVHSMGSFGITDANGASMDTAAKSATPNLNARTAPSASAIRGYNTN